MNIKYYCLILVAAISIGVSTVFYGCPEKHHPSHSTDYSLCGSALWRSHCGFSFNSHTIAPPLSFKPCDTMRGEMITHHDNCIVRHSPDDQGECSYSQNEAVEPDYLID